MKILYEATIAILAVFLAFFVAPTSGACLPCQPSLRRYTAWDTYRDFHYNSTRIPRTIYNPKITNPTKDTIWKAGSQAVVTWDTIGIPDNTQNPKGSLLLGHMTDGSQNEHLDLHHELASGFNLRDGHVKFDCPKVVAGSNYIVVLLGDSGNRSPTFTILP